MITFGIKGFRRWLESLPAHTVVGQPHKCWDCPLARYGSAQGGTHVNIAHHGIIIHTPSGPHQILRATQPWHRRFMRRVDGNAGPITREQALEALAALDMKE